MTDTTMPAANAGETTAGEAGVAPGVVLREAREAAGLSIDAIAQQLKLHPRQVQALEDGQHDTLPGRTFVRGFLRNYARALQLDPERLLAMLPDTAPESLGTTTHSMGEIRFENEPRRSWSRWVIPLALIALIAVAAVYEYLRPGAEPRKGAEPSAASQGAIAPAPPAVEPAPPATKGGTPLPNPLAGTASEPAQAAPSPGTGTGVPLPASATGAGAAPAPGNSAVVSTIIPPGTPGEPTLVIVFSGRSWVEVRDAKGKTLLSLTGSPGMTQSAAGTPPYDVVIGSVADVSLQYRGSPVDLDPYRRANVARLRLD